MKNYNPWFVVQLKANSIKIAERNLKRQLFNTFIPYERIKSLRPHKNSTELKPLFPGYLFVEFERSNMDWHKIKNTYGVSRILSCNNLPELLPGELIAELKVLTYKNKKSLPTYTNGDKIILPSGPFAKFVATIDKVDKDSRIYLLINFLGVETKLSMDCNKL